MTSTKRTGTRVGAVPADKKGTAKGGPRLTTAASLLKRWRSENGLGRQEDVAATLTRVMGREVSQSLVAQFETGKVTNPDYAMLRCMADLYGGSFEELVGAIITDKYRIPPFRASLLARDIKDVSELAKWESELPAETVLWVAAQNFLDADDPNIRESVVSLLKKNCKIVYFIAQRDTLTGGKFDTFRMQLSGYPDLGNRVPFHCPLEDGQLAMLSTSVVIANPLSVFDPVPNAEGYLIVDKDGRPEFGIRMSLSDTQKRVALLRSFEQKARPVKLERVA